MRRVRDSLDGASRVPRLLRDSADWTWRLLVLAIGAYLLVWFLGQLELVVLPMFAALLFTAVLRPPVQWLRRHGVPRGLATWLVILLGFAVIGGIAALVVDRAIVEYPRLVDEVSTATNKLRDFLVTGPLKLDPKRVDNLEGTITSWLHSHQGQVTSTAVTGIRTILDVLAAAVLTFFITFFFVFDGERIWSWLVGLFPTPSRRQVRAAGTAAWGTMSGYVRGTVIIASFHGLAIGLSLFVMGVPLYIPLALVVFVGAFIPIVGAVLAGSLAVVVTLLSKGFVLALILVGILVGENQAEAHLLQPFVVGRYVKLHPLAIALVLAGGAFLAGIPGAIVGVPLVAAVNSAVGAAHRQRRVDGNAQRRVEDDTEDEGVTSTHPDGAGRLDWQSV